VVSVGGDGAVVVETGGDLCYPGWRGGYGYGDVHRLGEGRYGGAAAGGFCCYGSPGAVAVTVVVTVAGKEAVGTTAVFVDGGDCRGVDRDDGGSGRRDGCFGGDEAAGGQRVRGGAGEGCGDGVHALVVSGAVKGSAMTVMGVVSAGSVGTFYGPGDERHRAQEGDKMHDWQLMGSRKL
jgi:hypothetical protein